MLTITIDAGHKKNYNKGAFSGYYEGNAMMTLAKHLVNALGKYNDVETVLTRDENGNPSLEERGKLAVNNGSKVFISLHSNATSETDKAVYVCGFYSIKRPNSKELCKKLTDTVTSVMKSTGATNKGALTKKINGVDYYGVIRSSVEGDSPVEYSFLIEHGFHSTKKQCEFLMSDSNLKKIAVAEAKVIADYFGLKVKEDKEVIYRVQVGAFAKRENAESMLQSIKSAGFEGFITTVDKAEVITESKEKGKPPKTLEQIAKEVINGDYGSGHATREKNLAEAGLLEFYTYQDIRDKVNEMYKK